MYLQSPTTDQVPLQFLIPSSRHLFCPYKQKALGHKRDCDYEFFFLFFHFSAMGIQTGLWLAVAAVVSQLICIKLSRHRRSLTQRSLKMNGSRSRRRRLSAPMQHKVNPIKTFLFPYFPTRKARKGDKGKLAASMWISVAVVWPLYKVSVEKLMGICNIEK